jgi:hypothetical protein
LRCSRTIVSKGFSSSKLIDSLSDWSALAAAG